MIFETTSEQARILLTYELMKTGKKTFIEAPSENSTTRISNMVQ